MAYDIPSELIRSLSAGRVIPFIGAGFSSDLNLPSWDQLLKQLASDLDVPLSYEEIRDYCNGDKLQIAEYYLLKCDKSIGPIRYSISRTLTPSVNPLRSGAHIELVNLGAPQIYTTNYDDLIEETFKRLGVPVDVVALPKDVATSTGKKTQVVKYHGDLRHESTLVLTESSYYARLDFESPMDLKFRSDLLGKSVLFMGYSFGDLNIRIIWYKLMRLMKDIPSADRPSSYVIRFEPNPVLQLLYEDVGIKSIFLDPDKTAVTAKEKTELLQEFLHELSTLTSVNGKIPGQEISLFMSNYLLNKSMEEIETPKRRAGMSVRFSRSRSLEYTGRIPGRGIPRELLLDLILLLARVAERAEITEARRSVALALKLIRESGPQQSATEIIVLAFSYPDTHEEIVAQDVPWNHIWQGKIREQIAKVMFEKSQAELDHHSASVPDAELAYCVDIMYRIAQGYLLEEPDENAIQQAAEFLEEAAKLYSTVADYDVQPDEKPNLDKLLEQITERRGRFEDDIPF